MGRKCFSLFDDKIDNIVKECIAKKLNVNLIQVMPGSCGLITLKSIYKTKQFIPDNTTSIILKDLMMHEVKAFFLIYIYIYLVRKGSTYIFLLANYL